MHKRRLVKPDGRPLILYARGPLPNDLAAPSASTTPHAPNAHLRWHPLRGEWIAYAGHRQNRTFLPPAEYNPLAASPGSAYPTEVPAGPWDVAVFENLFPTLTMRAHDPPTLAVETAPAHGACEGRRLHRGYRARREGQGTASRRGRRGCLIQRPRMRRGAST